MVLYFLFIAALCFLIVTTAINIIILIILRVVIGLPALEVKVFRIIPFRIKVCECVSKIS